MKNNLSDNDLKAFGFVEIKYFDNIKPNLYYINSSGQVYSKLINSFIKPDITHDGYARVNLIDKNNNRKNFQIHRLVAYTFLGEPPKNIKDPEVDHINRDRLNNNILNLRWVSRSDNLNNREFSNKIQLTSNDIHSICKKLENHDYETLEDLANEFKISRAAISDIKRGHTWKNISKQYLIYYKKNSSYLPDSIVHAICNDIQLKRNNRLNITLDSIADKYKVNQSTVRAIANHKIYSDISSQYNFGKNKIDLMNERQSSLLLSYKMGIPYLESKKEFNIKNAYDIYNKFIKDNKPIDFTFGNNKEIQLSFNDVNKNNTLSKYNNTEFDINDIKEPKITNNIKYLQNIIPMTKEIAHSVCKDLSNHNYTNLSDIAKRYKISYQIVLDIKMGRNWKDVSSQYDISNGREISSICSKETIIDIIKDISESRKDCIFTEPLITLKDIANKYKVKENFVKSIADRNNFKELSEKYDFGYTQKQRRQNRKDLIFKCFEFGLNNKNIKSYISEIISYGVLKKYSSEYKKANKKPLMTFINSEFTIFDLDKNKEIADFTDFKATF